MNVCTCPDPEMLHDYLRGALDAADATAIDGHLEGCLACQAAVDALDARDNAVFACLKDTPAGSEDPALRRLVNRAIGLGSSTAVENGRGIPEVDGMPLVLGNYTLLELIGAGGMGQVFKAEHQRMKRIVALKVLAPQLVRSPASRARFQREVEAMSRLSSPYIVAAFDAGEADGRDYLVMEYVAGQTLADRVRQSGPLPIALALDCMMQAARGLQHAHDAGIVHRDVKPSNILLECPSNEAHVKLLDLGLARLRTDEVHDLTGSNAPMGTTHFMAPEQAANPRAVDARADVYGLGCTLFYLLTGQPPYEGDSAMAVLLAHREKPIPSLRALRPDCPPALDALLCRLLAKRAADRPASMRDVIAALERVRRTPHAAAPRRRRWPLPALALTAASLLLAVALWPLLSDGVPSPGPAFVAADGPDKKAADTAAPDRQVGSRKGPTIDMVPIPAGNFWIGASDSDKFASPNEMPRKHVTIKLAFSMGKTEVTQAQYEAVMGVNPSAFSAKGQYAQFIKGQDTSQHPVESVAWIDAVRFCNRLSERHDLKPFYKIDKDRVTIAGGTGYRLPKEAEWEYACRGGTQTTWYFGENADKLGEHAWYSANSGDATHPVGGKKVNPFGLYDMYGNVPEWCWDRYDAQYYESIAASDPVSTSTNTDRAFRGGGWNSRVAQLRTTTRQPLAMHYGGPGSFHHIGFRVVRSSEN